ncbi:MAG: hypothetical protein GX247_00380 [Mollicutes bacterium]|nr:hypothetical protein [Mollicutes bacterium]
MCYLKGNYHLGEFLYSQPTYKDNEQKVKDESDLVILKVLSDKKPKLEEFIKNPKFTCNLSRYIYLMQLLVINIKKNSEQIEIKDLDTFDELLISKMSEEDKEMLEISRLRYNKNNEKDSYLSILKGNSLSNLERKKLK